ncbi:hypothetical protein Tco_0525308 [Tanacetum coccineum]
MSTYLKHMGGYKHSELKNKSFEEIQKLFNKEITRVNMFVDMDTETKEGSKKAKADTLQESSSKRACDELKQEKAKKQKVDDDQEETEMKKRMEIVINEEEVAVDAIPLATKPLMISIDKEDLETLWKLVKAKHGNTRPDEEYKRVLWGDLKVMFEPDVESEVWRSIEGHNVTIWKLFDSCEVHFVRFKNMHIFMLLEKKYPLTPATITGMLNKKLQIDQWNKMSYQLLNLMGRIVGIKSLLMLLGVNTAMVRVTAVKHNLVMLVILVKNMLSISAADTKVNDDGYKLQLLKRLQLLEEFLLSEG